jgi:hypothetical protein
MEIAAISAWQNGQTMLAVVLLAYMALPIPTRPDTDENRCDHAKTHGHGHSIKRRLTGCALLHRRFFPLKR